MAANGIKEAGQQDPEIGKQSHLYHHTGDIAEAFAAQHEEVLSKTECIKKSNSLPEKVAGTKEIIQQAREIMSLGNLNDEKRDLLETISVFLVEVFLDFRPSKRDEKSRTFKDMDVEAYRELEQEAEDINKQIEELEYKLTDLNINDELNHDINDELNHDINDELNHDINDDLIDNQKFNEQLWWIWSNSVGKKMVDKYRQAMNDKTNYPSLDFAKEIADFKIELARKLKILNCEKGEYLSLCTVLKRLESDITEIEKKQ